MQAATCSVTEGPDSVGRYHVLSELGRGSMGVVYLGFDPKLQREVAIKTILVPEGYSEAQRQAMTRSLLQEARLAAALAHPGIVRVFDAGEDHSLPYIVFERIEGVALSTRLAEEGALGRDGADRLMGELLDALAYAHERQIIHRDIKPANLMVQADGRLRVMDFGIARALADQPQSGRRVLCGTPRYMSPEQIDGRAVDTRSDVFSLGIVFYEMLCGQRPFPQKDFQELREALVGRPHPPLHHHNPDLPPSYYGFIDRALAKSPEERFADARQMRDALHECMADRSAPVAAAGEDVSAARQQILDEIRRQIERQGDFPATSQYLARVTAAARSSHSSASTIANEILKDFALTNRILRMVNSPFYAGIGGRIRTISRAVVILGVDTVLSTAGGLSIFEHFHNRSGVAELKQQAVKALMTGLHARQLAHAINLENAEEAFICGMLHHLGRLIVAFYFPQEYQRIEKLIDNGTPTERASRKVMRLSYLELGEAMAQFWNMPESIVRAIHGLDPEHKGAPQGSVQMTQAVVSMAEELSHATFITDPEQRQAALKAVERSFRDKIHVGETRLMRLVEDSLRNAWDISHALRVDLKSMGVTDALLHSIPADPGAEAAPAARPRPGVSAAAVEATASISGDVSSPSLTLDDPDDERSQMDENALAVQRQDLMAKTMAEISQALAGQFQLNDVLVMILEAMYRGIGCDHVLMAMVNPQRSHVIGRFGLGDQIEEAIGRFNFPLRAGGGAPVGCIMNRREYFVPDLSDPAHHGLLPRPLDEVLRAEGLILVPLDVRDQAIGLFMATRRKSRTAFARQDLRDLRALSRMAVTGIQQSAGQR